MYIASDNHEANLLFRLISHLYNNASIIISSNRSPDKWGDLVEDKAAITAILDRLLHYVEVVNMDGDSYRIKNSQRIFKD